MPPIHWSIDMNCEHNREHFRWLSWALQQSLMGKKNIIGWSLFSGHANAVIPISGGDCDHMIEHSLPAALKGTTYYISP